MSRVSLTGLRGVRAMSAIRVEMVQGAVKQLAGRVAPLELSGTVEFLALDRLQAEPLPVLVVRTVTTWPIAVELKLRLDAAADPDIVNDLEAFVAAARVVLEQLKQRHPWR